jgi:hypothetical protein
VVCSPSVSQPKPCMHFLSLSSWWYHPHNILWVQIIKFLTIQSSSHSCYILPLRLNCLPQQSILEHPQPMFFT